MYGTVTYYGSVLGADTNLKPQTSNGKRRKSVFLSGANFSNEPMFTKVAPATITNIVDGPNNNTIVPLEIQKTQSSDSVIYDVLKPIVFLMRALGIFPVACIAKETFRPTPILIGYSAILFLIILAYIGYIKWDTVEFVTTDEGRFEEVVIKYLFTVYLVPILITPIAWYECRKLGNVFGSWGTFEKIYEKVQGRKIPLFIGNKPLITTFIVPILACGTMVATHVTMVYFRFLQVIPYCYVNALTFVTGAFWYLHCDVIARVAILLADDFQKALKHVGPSGRVAEFRALWMLLARITRDVGLGSCYVLTFLNLYLFLTITLTIYGLLSTLQEGIGIKDVGLTITAAFSVALLYFVCDQAHFASNCVRVNFQKKLLLVELSWMNDDAQQEIQMFLRATEMNPTDMSLGGFFDVNRNLFKSLLATMVTYLVVLLQFQISIPGEADHPSANSTLVSPPTKKQ